LISHRKHTEDLPVPFTRGTELRPRGSFRERSKRIAAPLWNGDEDLINTGQNG
jgi:hypothetical protein